MNLFEHFIHIEDILPANQLYFVRNHPLSTKSDELRRLLALSRRFVLPFLFRQG